jgi:hypothetical protein
LLRTQSEFQNTLYHTTRGKDLSSSLQIWEECTTLPSAMQLQILQTLGKLKQLLSSEVVGDSPTGKNATQEYRLHVLVNGSRRYFLIDSGSAISVIPTSFFKHQVQPGLLKLCAANAAKIDTYGEVTLNFFSI